MILYLIIFSIIDKILAVSYNQPKFCSFTTWNTNAITFANSNTVGLEPYGIFVDANNSIYVANRDTLRIQIWYNRSTTPTRTLSGNLTYPRSIFVTTNGDIYVDNGDSGRVDKWTLNDTKAEIFTNFSGICFGLFVDINNYLYCSVGFGHLIEKISLNTSNKKVTTVAGNSTSGSTANLLNDPRGIFVDINLDLYVADSDNSRIQRFRSGEIFGTTVAGNGASGTFTLVTPHGVFLDGDGYLFITDSGNNRIIGSGPNGFRCLFGCSGKGSTANKLSFPQTMAFDSDGNIFVSDRDNNRIQKFLLATNSCKSTTTHSTITSITTELATKSKTITMTQSTTELMTESTTEQLTELTTEPITELTVETTTELVIKLMTDESTDTYFVPPTCTDTTRIGLTCDLSNMPCDVIQPCQNNGICNNTNITSYGYYCSCSDNFSGINCEINHHPCEPNPCWNAGECNVLNATFNCTCGSGWEGSHCQTKVNYCKNATCLHKGVCRPLFRNYTCECLSGSYSGFHCEITATRITIYQIVSKSFAYVAIIVMISAAIFIIVMDILKYYFGIDPTHQKWTQIRQLARTKIDKFRIIRPAITVTPPSPRFSIPEPSITDTKLSI